MPLYILLYNSNIYKGLRSFVLVLWMQRQCPVHKCCISLLQYTILKGLVSPGPEVTKLFSCSSQLGMKFFLLINVKMPTIVGILTLMSRIIAFSTYLSLKKAEFLDIF